MATTVRNAGSTQLKLSRRRAERRAATDALRVDRDLIAGTDVERPAELTAGQYLGRSLIIGSLIGVLLMTAAVYVMALAIGFGPSGSLGIAVFCAFWGGLGFGCMAGAVASSAREERREVDKARDVAAAARRPSVADGSQ